MEQAAQDDIYGIAQRTLEAHKAKTEFMRMFTSEAVKKVDDASLDYVYVGGWVRCGGGGGGRGVKGWGGQLAGMSCRGCSQRMAGSIGVPSALTAPALCTSPSHPPRHRCAA